MLERIVLAAIITFCMYLFVNFGGKSSNSNFLEAKELFPGLIPQIAWFSR
ncbi:hypothetical protein IQ255_17525 [Pleurocapsales cyanobacterium LEGE 10410]|nr:hypothetical protein [Pleurocapsales cyanobacterium LEGE 10410]